MVLHPLRAFYKAVTGRSVAHGDLICWFCGCDCAAGLPPASVLRPTFNNHDRARAGGDGPICEACAHYFDFKISHDHSKRGMGLYTKSVLITAGEVPTWRQWDREEMADNLLEWREVGMPEPTYLTCNYSRQKHVLPWAKLTQAGVRDPWITTDNGHVRLPPDWPALLGCVAWLVARGYPRAVIRGGTVGVYQLARSDDPGSDLAVVRVLAPHVGPTVDYLTYIVTEGNCERICASLAGQVAALLGGYVSGPATCCGTRDHHECGCKPNTQESVSKAVVANARRACEALCDHQREPVALEQLTLL